MTTQQLFSSMAAPVRVQFVSSEARQLYNGSLEPATSSSVGTDLRACFSEEECQIAPGQRLSIPVGIRVQPLAAGIAGFVYSRSGLGARDGLTVAQGVGVIDPDYTGEIIVWLLNTAKDVRSVRRGERIAQLVFQPVCLPQWQESDLEQTERGTGGFGHTGR